MGDFHTERELDWCCGDSSIPQGRLFTLTVLASGSLPSGGVFSHLRERAYCDDNVEARTSTSVSGAHQTPRRLGQVRSGQN